MLRPKDIRTRWDRSRGWLVYAPVALPREQLLHIARWIRQRQLDRYHALPPGDRKDECALTIRHAEMGKIGCALTGDETTVFASNQRTRPDRSFHILGDNK